MTRENKQANILAELERAQAAKGAAQVLFEHGYLHDAVSRLYYWVFHNVRALLFSKGLEPKTHEGALRLFSLHFVKSGPFDAESAHIFARLMKYRQEADYSAEYVFRSDDFQEFLSDGQKLCNAIQGFLNEEFQLDFAEGHPASSS